MSNKQKADNKENRQRLNAEQPSFVSAPPGKTKVKGGRKERTLSPLFTKLMPWVGGLLFAIVAWFILVTRNSDYFFNVQERSLFLNTNEFFQEKMSVAGGLLQWAGCYLTQFFYYPALGCAMLIALWLTTYFVILKAFNMRKEWCAVALIPLFALLCSETDLGYWLYYLKMPGYWFKESLGFLIMMLGVWAASRLRGWWLAAWIALWTAGGYPLFGWYALLGSALMAFTYAFGAKGERRNTLLVAGLTVGLIIAVPLLWYHHFTQMRLEDAWRYGFPLFQSDKVISLITSAPFFVLALSPFAFVFLSKKEETQEALKGGKATTAIISFIAVMGIGTFVALQADFDNYNYHAEMRMYRYTEEGKWDKVLEEMGSIPGTPTRQMVLLKNIALMNTGKLGTQMFRYNNGGEPPYTRDSLFVRMTQTAASLIYFNYGRLNFATRWSIENGVEFGFQVNDLKIMAQSAILSGERALAKKYIKMLKATTFHANDAIELEKLLNNPSLAFKEEKYKSAAELHKHFKNMLDSDTGLCEIYLLNYFGNTMNKDSKLLQEVTLSYAMVNKNIQMFWPRFFLYATLHEQEEMPIHYQEAAYLYGTLEHEVDIRVMPFDQEKIVNRYASFNQLTQTYLRQGMTSEQVGEAVKDMFGDTFWWFYFFCRDVKSY